MKTIQIIVYLILTLSISGKELEEVMERDELYTPISHNKQAAEGGRREDTLAKWLDKEKSVDENDLIEAANEVVEDIYEANLGGNLFKKRISNKSNQGKSSGSRLILGYQEGNNFYYLHVFNKNDKGNISIKELKALKARIKILLTFGKKELDKAIKAKVLFEIGRENNE